MEAASEKNELTAERSLEIISRTLEESRRTITRGSWKSMMLWGISVMVIALVVGHFWAHSSMGPGANGLWGALGLVSLGERWANRNKPKLSKTFVSKTLGYVWGSMGVMAGTLGFVLGMIAFFHIHVPVLVPDAASQVHTYYVPITAIIILLMGIAGMTSGKILDSKIITYCGFIAGMVGCMLALVMPGPTEMLVLAGVSAVGLILPAWIIKQKEV